MRKQITGQSLADNLKKWINLMKTFKVYIYMPTAAC